MDARFRHALIAATVLALVPAVLAAQDVVVGHVTGEGGAPLPNATVYIAHTRLGGIAGADGAYRIVLPSGEVGQTVTITSRLIGYRERSQVVKLTAGTNTVDFALEAAPTAASRAARKYISPPRRSRSPKASAISACGSACR